MTDIENYLTESQKREIAEEVVRDKVSAALNDERQLSNLIYDVAQRSVQETLESELGNGWRKRLVVKAAEAINGGNLGFYIFRKRSPWEKEDGPGFAPMKAAVEKHAGLIEARVINAIDRMDDHDLGDLLRRALVSKLGGDSP